jgi:drug/metabolite transporter (DMT)-like permease
MKKRRTVWAGFAGLCLLSGSRWIEDQFWTSPLPPLVRLAVDQALLAAIFGVAAWLRRGGTQSPGWPRRLPAVAGWGVVLLALPAIAFVAANGRVEQSSVALVYTLVPALIVFLRAQQAAGFGAGGGEFSALLPALAGVGGAALLLQFRLPASVSGRVWLGVIVVVAGLTGLAAMRLHARLREANLLHAVTAVCGATAGVAGLFSWIFREGPRCGAMADVVLEISTALLIGGPIVLLTVWLLREIPPVRFSARYLLIPVVTILGGYVMLRPEVSWTTPAAVLLLGLGGWRLLAEPDAREP